MFKRRYTHQTNYALLLRMSNDPIVRLTFPRVSPPGSVGTIAIQRFEGMQRDPDGKISIVMASKLKPLYEHRLKHNSRGGPKRYVCRMRNVQVIWTGSANVSQNYKANAGDIETRGIIRPLL